jgi:hypothetical protein
LASTDAPVGVAREELAETVHLSKRLVIEAPWLVDGGHGASVTLDFQRVWCGRVPSSQSLPRCTNTPTSTTPRMDRARRGTRPIGSREGLPWRSPPPQTARRKQLLGTGRAMSVTAAVPTTMQPHIASTYWGQVGQCQSPQSVPTTMQNKNRSHLELQALQALPRAELEQRAQQAHRQLRPARE